MQWNMGTELKSLGFAQNREDKRLEMLANNPKQDKYLQAISTCDVSPLIYRPLARPKRTYRPFCSP